MTLREQIMSKIESKDKDKTKNNPNKIGLLEALKLINEHEKEKGYFSKMQFNTLSGYYHARSFNESTEKRVAKGLGL